MFQWKWPPPQGGESTRLLSCPSPIINKEYKGTGVPPKNNNNLNQVKKKEVKTNKFKLTKINIMQFTSRSKVMSFEGAHKVVILPQPHTRSTGVQVHHSKKTNLNQVKKKEVKANKFKLTKMNIMQFTSRSKVVSFEGAATLNPNFFQDPHSPRSISGTTLHKGEEKQMHNLKYLSHVNSFLYKIFTVALYKGTI